MSVANADSNRLIKNGRTLENDDVVLMHVDR